MSTLIKAQIQARIASMLFSDSSKVLTRVSEIIVKDGNIGFSIDIHGKDGSGYFNRKITGNCRG